jgi:hypothetical protein
MLNALTVVFQRAKDGSSPREWEDGAGFDPGDPAAARRPRALLLDGATDAFDAIRWVGLLVDSFLGSGDVRPTLDRAGIVAWFAQAQREWVDRAPAGFASVFEERKFAEQGSFATLLGCDLDLDGATPTWSAVALGDAVLFHLRDGRLIDTFPPMAAGDFGIDPAGISTQPSQLERMSDGLLFGRGAVSAGDRLLLCTDALAAWALESAAAGTPQWSRLAAISHPVVFDDLVRRELAGRRLKNDDVTLMRIELSASDANVLVVCRP